MFAWRTRRERYLFASGDERGLVSNFDFSAAILVVRIWSRALSFPTSESDASSGMSSNSSVEKV